MFDGPPFRRDGFVLLGVTPVAAFVGIPWAVAWVIAGFRPKRTATTASTMNSQQVQERLKKSEGVLHWVHANLNGLKVPDLPTNKRKQLAGGCWHIAIDHQMAITLLVDETLHASALALMRPMVEAYVRGMWLAYAANDDEVDKAGRDDFPSGFFTKIIAELEQPGRFKPGALSHLKGDTWKRMCSYTHSGYQQIGARLTPDGLVPVASRTASDGLPYDTWFGLASPSGSR